MLRPPPHPRKCWRTFWGPRESHLYLLRYRRSLRPCLVAPIIRLATGDHPEGRSLSLMIPSRFRSGSRKHASQGRRGEWTDRVASLGPLGAGVWRAGHARRARPRRAGLGSDDEQARARLGARWSRRSGGARGGCPRRLGSCDREGRRTLERGREKRVGEFVRLLSGKPAAELETLGAAVDILAELLAPARHPS